jgi:GGDEF domain-containing protein
MSIGVAEYDPSRPCKVEELMLEADRLMYIQKKEKKQAGGYHI